MSVADKKKRIGVIDFYRSFALLGIIVIHAYGNVFSHVDTDYSKLEEILRNIVSLLLMDRCNTIFNILFGVSFYLILKNPNNTSGKFIWRCLLLCLFGVINMYFYWGDVLLLYGLCGILLTAFRNSPPKALFLCSLLFIVFSAIANNLKIADNLPEATTYDRCDLANTVYTNMVECPLSIYKHLKFSLNGSLFRIFAFFLLGYSIAKKGYIDALEDISNVKNITKALIVSVLFFELKKIPCAFFYYITYLLFISSCSILYCLIISYIYYRCTFMKTIFSKFEPYGKLGLTNYSMQSILLVLFLTNFNSQHLFSYSESLTIAIVF